MRILSFILFGIFSFSVFIYANDAITTTGSNGGVYNLFLLIYFVIIIVTMFMGYGDDRKVVIFHDYDDVGLSFLIPASFLLILYLFLSFGGNPKFGILLASIIAMVLFVLLVQNTYISNNKSFVHTILSIITKIPLSIIWLLSLIFIVNPIGKTAIQRRKNKNIAMVILVILTPIIGMLVAEKQGSLFNPKKWMKRKQYNNSREYL